MQDGPITKRHRSNFREGGGRTRSISCSAQASSLRFHNFCNYKNKLTALIFVVTVIHMDVAFDTNKNTANIEKHGVSLAAAASIEWDSALSWPDERHDYGEARTCAIAYIGDRLHYVVYVDREELRRVISCAKPT